MHIIIGTRGSDLALAQTDIVKKLVTSLDPSITVEIKVIKTEGDKNMAPIPTDVVGKGWFTKEIEKALLTREIDLAEHSLKDLGEVLPEGLIISAIPARGDVRDVLVSKNNIQVKDLPEGAIIGTDSARRKVLLLQMRTDLQVESVRGNVNTRLRKLQEEDYDALVLAAAGLQRLGMEDIITEYFDPFEFIPAPGQGAIAIQTRSSDTELNRLLVKINDTKTELETIAERLFTKAMGGGCKLPVGAYAVIEGDQLKLYGMVAEEDGSYFRKGSITGKAKDVEKLGKDLVLRLQ